MPNRKRKWSETKGVTGEESSKKVKQQDSWLLKLLANYSFSRDGFNFQQFQALCFICMSKYDAFYPIYKYIHVLYTFIKGNSESSSTVLQKRIVFFNKIQQRFYSPIYSLVRKARWHFVTRRLRKGIGSSLHWVVGTFPASNFLPWLLPRYRPLYWVRLSRHVSIHLLTSGNQCISGIARNLGRHTFPLVGPRKGARNVYTAMNNRIDLPGIETNQFHCEYVLNKTF